MPVSRKRLLSGDLKTEVNFPVRAYPAGAEPRLTLNMIESRLKGNRYQTVYAFKKEFEELVETTSAKWEDCESKKAREKARMKCHKNHETTEEKKKRSMARDEEHEIIKASKKVLSDIEEAIRNMPASAPTVSRTVKYTAVITVGQSTTTTLTGEQISRFLVEISNVIRIHGDSPLFPGDSNQPILDLEKFGRDVQQGRYGSFMEAYRALEQILNRSEDLNGFHHRITLLISRVLKHVTDSPKEATPEAESLELEASSDEQMLDNAELGFDSEVPLGTTKKKIIVKQKQQNCRAGKKTDRQRPPPDLVAERIAKEVKRRVAKNSEIDVNVDHKGIRGEGGGKNSKAKLKVRDNTKSYADYLPELPEDLPTLKQICALRKAEALGPNFLGRTASLTSGTRFGPSNKTNGSTTQDVLLPAAETNEDFGQHATLEDLKQREIIYMTGHHLAWADLDRDELLSYSTDMLFLLVHALGRANRGQGGVTIQLLDCRKSKTPGGDQAAFYSALDIYTIFEVPKWPGWRTQHRIKLHPRKFTHEFLSHGAIICKDSALKQAALEDLIRDGLFEIFPPLKTPEDHKQEGLYTVQVICRRIGYPPRNLWIGEENPPLYSYEECPQVKAMTVEILQTVRKVSLNFCHGEEGLNTVVTEPPLHAFIGFLTFEKRQPADPVFTEWIKQHYTCKSHASLMTPSSPY